MSFDRSTAIGSRRRPEDEDKTFSLLARLIEEGAFFKIGREPTTGSKAILPRQRHWVESPPRAG
jgi:hypothetical protein